MSTGGSHRRLRGITTQPALARRRACLVTRSALSSLRGHLDHCGGSDLDPRAALRFAVDDKVRVVDSLTKPDEDVEDVGVVVEYGARLNICVELCL